jgi:hypothetical protein
MGRTGRTALRLDAGHWPQGPDQVAVKNSVAEVLDLHLGGLWDQGGTRRTVVGVVENPQNLRDAFVLVAPGQIGSPDHVDVLIKASNDEFARNRAWTTRPSRYGRTTLTPPPPSFWSSPRSGWCSLPSATSCTTVVKIRAAPAGGWRAAPALIQRPG